MHVEVVEVEDRVRPSMLNSRANHFIPNGVNTPSLAATQPSSVRASFFPSVMRPTVITDVSNTFSEAKVRDANVQVFANDVLMEGELTKKGESGLNTWKSVRRCFVLRGQELSYYTIDTQKKRYGAFKGSWDLAGAIVERQENLSFTIKLADGNAPTLIAPNVQTLMDWMTAIAVAGEALVVDPPTDLSIVDQSRTTHIILVRHGHYVSPMKLCEDAQGPLSDLGIQQALATGQFLHNYLSERLVLKRFPVFPIYHTGIRRAVETAERIKEAFPTNSLQLYENKLFREAWPSNPLPSNNRQHLAREKLDNMVSDCSRLKMAYRTTFRHLIPQDLETGERQLSEQDLQHYADTFGGSTQTRAKDRFRIIVCHANVIRWFVCKALGVDPEGTWGRMRYNHCGITSMDIDSVGNVQLNYMNQTGHLETTQLSEL